MKYYLHHVFSVLFTECFCIIFNSSGNPDKPDEKGCSPLHIAATYGNYEAIEILLEHKSNIFALDNRGMHAAKVAVLNKRLDCYRILDTLHYQLRASNPEYVKIQQTKAINMLEKRLQKGEKTKRPHATTTENGKISRFRIGGSLKKKSMSQIGDDTFTLKDPNKKEEKDEEDTDEEDEVDGGDIFDPIFVSHSAKNTLRPLPKITSGAMLQTFSGMARTSYDDTASTSSDPIKTGRSRKQFSTHTGNVIGAIQPLNPTEYEIEDDSSLVTFLHSVDAYETGGILLQEKMDLTSLMLCSENDLKSIGLALGPRKRIMDGIRKRDEALKAKSNKMTDTAF